MLEPSKERREITSRDRVFAKTSRDARRDLREIEKWIRSPPPGALHFYGKSERNPLFHPQKANRRAQSSRARDDAKRIFRFERRDVNKNAFTHRATRKRERLHGVLLNATTRDEFLLLPFFFFSLSSVSAAQSFFSLSYIRTCLPPSDIRMSMISDLKVAIQELPFYFLFEQCKICTVDRQIQQF